MLSDEEKISLNRMKLFARSSDLSVVTAKDMNIVVTLVEKQSKEIERTNEIIIWKQRHEEQLQKEIERLKDKLNKIYNETDNKNSQLVKALNYKLFMEDKIKAKIEEIKNECKYCDFTDEFCQELLQNNNCTQGNTLKVLQSLLEKE